MGARFKAIMWAESELDRRSIPLGKRSAEHPARFQHVFWWPSRAKPRSNFNKPSPFPAMILIYQRLPWLLLLVVLVACSSDASPTGAAPQSPAVQDVAATRVAKRQPIEPDPTQKLANPEDWPTFLGPRGDGTSSETGLDPGSWNPHPPILWTAKLGVSYGPPTVADGKLYQFDRYNDSERLTCYDAAKGDVLWHWEYPVMYSDSYGYNNGPRCSPIIDGDRAYIYGVTGQMSCVSIATGKPLWTKNLNEVYGVVGNFFGVASNPCVHENLLLTMVGGSPAASQSLTSNELQYVQPDGNAIVAFDKITGEEVYQVGDDLASYSSVVVRTLNDRPVGLALARSGLLAWEPSSGQELFRFPWRAGLRDSVNAAVPVTAGNRILLSEAYEIGSVLLEISGATPKVVWKDAKRQLRDCSFRAHWSTPVLVGGYLYGGNGRNQPDCDFRCIDFETGEVQWTFWRHERSSVLLVDNYLVAIGELGTLKLLRPNPASVEEIVSVDMNAINSTDGEPLLRSPCWAAPVLAGGRMYIRGRERLVCFELLRP